MEIKLIRSIDQFDKLKQNWNDVYTADPHAPFYASWSWIRGWLETTLYDWLVLAFQPDAVSPYSAFMVLGSHSNRNFGFQFIQNNNLHMGGNPISDHTGFLCLPDHVDAAIPAFGKFIQRQIKWNTFSMMDVFDPRLDLFLQGFSSRRFCVQELESASCPYISLPDTWSRYLQEFLSQESRKSLKYKMGQVNRLHGLTLVYAQADNLKTQIEALLALWQTRWGEASEYILNRYRTLFQRSFEDNTLWLSTLWADTTPIAGVAGLIDRKLKTFILYTPVYNNKFSKFSPGRVMVGYSIRYAIENGFQIYDFGVGDEQYKFSFGAKERLNRNIVIVQKTIFKSIKKRIPGKLKNLGSNYYQQRLSSLRKILELKYFQFIYQNNMSKAKPQADRKRDA